MKNNRISIFLPSLAGGGAERVMVTLANGFAARGYTTDLVVVMAEGPYLKDVAPTVHIVDFKASLRESLWPLMRYLQREQPVAMLSALTPANIVALLAKMCSQVRTRLVISERSTISVECKHAVHPRERIAHALVPFLYRKAEGIVAISQGAASDLEQFAKLPRNSVRTIYNPFDLARIQKMASEPSGHPWLDAPLERRPVIIGIGRLTKAKNFPLLLQAFSWLAKTHRARLLILGEGKLREKLTHLARNLGLGHDDVQMPGSVANPFAYLSRAALFVLSSDWEGLPGVLIEALACGTPVVSTDCPSGPREILEEGKWGRLVPVGDAKALAEAMDEVLRTPRDRLPDVRKRAEDFNQERAINSYLEVLGLPPYAEFPLVL
ncbi:MAG: glycosyl transferase [Thermosynechococcus sp.]|uniref:glycosyltransferase n=1 Tax=Thermosynechococcus sp. TaxID=2814275 RepID=UPI0022004CA1|nr:glycosyltransferase [Thermosynechococcus sp.]BCX11979.1 MAG: glycosyl transferase [Thermosynechococcus sp.]